MKTIVSVGLREEGGREGGREGETFRTFGKQVEGKTGQPITLNTLTIAGVCSESI